MGIARASPGKPRWRSAQAVVVATLVVSALVFTAGGLGDSGVRDTDADGLFDLVETSGWTTQNGRVFVTDPNNPDTDGDGLSDGAEAGAVTTHAGFATGYLGLSNPRVPDTDGDQVGDADEYFLDMDPQSRDSDSDGLLDNLELDFGSDPTRANPDGDSYTDNEERDRGSDPLAYTLTRGEFVAATVAGGTFGDCVECARRAGIRDEQIQSVAYLAGHLASGAAVYGDLRDLGADLWKGDFPAAGLSAFGLVPGYGDSAKTVRTLERFAKLGGPASHAVREFVETRLSLPPEAKSKVLYRIFGAKKWAPLALKGELKDHVVYVGRSPTGSVIYAGITKDFARRQVNHGDRFMMEPINGASGLSSAEAHAIEEALIKRGGFVVNGGKLVNKVHSISTNRVDYEQAVAWGEQWLVSHAFTGL